MILTRWEIENYKSFLDTEVEVGDQVILAGENDSGKSNLLDSIEDYRKLFGNAPRATEWSHSYNDEELGYSEWYNISASTYADDDAEGICFTGRFEPRSETEWTEIVSSIESSFAAPRGWASDREYGEDFNFFSHSITVDTTGLDKEILYTTIGGIRVPIAFRDPSTGSIFEFLFQKITHSNSEVEYGRPESLDPIPYNELNTIIRDGNESLQSEIWYEERSAATASDDVGSVILEELHEYFPVGRWKKIDAKRIPNPRITADDIPTVPDGEQPEISSDAADLLAFLRQAADNDGVTIDEISDRFGPIIETVSDIQFDYDTSGESTEISIQFSHADRSEFRLDQVSDGVLQAICLVVALETSSQTNRLLLIEEPEVHLHSNAIRNIWTYIEELIEAENLRIIAATHSQTIINRGCDSQLHGVTRTRDSELFPVAFDSFDELLRGTNRTIGDLLQAKAVVLVGSTFEKHLVDTVCRTRELALLENGVELFALPKFSKTAFDQVAEAVENLLQFEIPVRVLVPSNQELPTDFNRVLDRREGRHEGFSYLVSLPDSGSGWLQENAELYLRAVEHGPVPESETMAFETEVASMGENEDALHVARISEVLSTISTKRVRRVEVLRALEQVEFDADRWQSVYDDLSGLV